MYSFFAITFILCLSSSHLHVVMTFSETSTVLSKRNLSSESNQTKLFLTIISITYFKCGLSLVKPQFRSKTFSLKFELIKSSYLDKRSWISLVGLKVWLVPSHNETSFWRHYISTSWCETVRRVTFHYINKWRTLSSIKSATILL